jgi:hypothetical protein
MPLEDEQRQGPGFPVVTDARRWENVSPEDRLVAEREAIAAVLAKFDPETRERVRRLLEGDGLPSHAVGGFAGASDPDVARLLGVISSIRWAELQSRMASTKKDWPSKELMQVQVALVPELAQQDARVTVVRRPGDAGIPLLLLRDRDLTLADLDLGLNEAALSLQRDGVAPPTELTMQVATGPAPANPCAEARHLDLVRAGQVRMLEGVGNVRTSVVVVPLHRSGR